MVETDKVAELHGVVGAATATAAKAKRGKLH